MINAWWFTEHNNFGDKLNPYLINKISGNQAKLVEDKSIRKHLCVGSIMHLADEKCTVWGSGFISGNHTTKGTPEILAVRGPKTRQMLLENNQKCPETYGDPALLLPKYFNPSVSKKHKFGIIPHYIDKSNKLLNKFQNSDIKTIDIQNDIEKVILDILACEVIFSSSLHGIIAADAYGIPAYWIKFHNKLGDFKFEDYLLSVGRSPKPILICDKTTLDDMIELTKDYEININLDKLYESCPFKPEKISLSVLICTIPSRTRSLIRLLYMLEKQAKNKPVEILFLGDNRIMSVGKKRNKLLEMASGKYVTFIDDDDRISENYIDSILSKTNNNSDVIVFGAKISENGSEYKSVVYDRNFKHDKNLPNKYERMPNHLMATKRDLALKAGFPEQSFAEDHEYAKRLQKLTKCQSVITDTLYYYDFDEKKSETRNKIL